MTHVKRGATAGVVVSTCSWINEKAPERVKKIGKTIAAQVCCDSLLDLADNGFKVLRIQTTVKRYVVKGQYLLSCTSGVDFTVRAGIVLIPEACRVIRFNNFVELVPKVIQENGGPIKYVLKPRPGTPPYQNPTSVFYKPIFKLKPLVDNYGVMKLTPVF